MDDSEAIIQNLRQEVAKWKGRTIEAAMEACTICLNYVKPEVIDCQHCRMKEFQEQAK